MKKNKKLIAVLSLFTLMFVTILTSFVLSAFAVNSDIESGFGTGEVKYETTGVDVTGKIDFAEPGDNVNGNFSIKNIGDTPFKYSFGINLTRTIPLEYGEVGIENAIFVYIDNDYIGRLIDLTSDKYIHNVSFPLTPLDKSIHDIRFEYHIDAGSNYDNDIHLDVDVAAVSALNYDSDFVFVNNYNALQQYARKSNYLGRTIVLTNDISLEKDVELKVACHINLNSHKINLNGYKLSIAGTGIKDVVRISNRVDADPIRATRGYFDTNSNINSKVIFNTPNGLVLDYTNCEVIEVVEYSKTLLADSFASYLTNLTRNGVSSDLNITDGFGPYFESSGITPLILNSPSASINFTISGKTATMNITRLDLTQDEPVLITSIDIFREVNVRIWGNSDDASIDQYLNHVVGFTNTYLPEKSAYAVSSDIFLPKQIQSLGAQIIWRSSIPEVISTNGKVVRPYKNSLSNVELTAYITCNGVTTSRSYNLFVYKKTAEEILKEIIYELESLLTFAYVYESKDNENVRELFTAEDFAHLGVTKIEYLDIKDVYKDIFELDKSAPTLELIRDTVLSTAELGLKIEVTDEVEVTEASGEAKIRIDINRTMNIFDAMYNHLLTYISHITTNTLDSFEVPSIYLEDGNSYKYSIIPGEFEYATHEFTQNPTNVNEYANVSADGKQIIIDKYRVPNENTTVTVLVEMTSYGQTSYRTMKFDISGVLLLNRDIMDANLFYKLRQLIDRDLGNNDGFITRDEIDAASITEYSQTDSYITSLVGLEYFTSLQKLDLSNNQIADVTPLGALTNLTELNLSKNRIININNLDTLTNLNTLNLSSNEIIDISNLTYLESLTHLYLDNNLAISDLSPIVSMESLEYLTVYNTAATNPTNLKFNLNYLITQYTRIGGASKAKFYVANASTIWHPTQYEQNANIIVNYIEPIEEISDMIVLPMQIEYDGIVYPIYWETNAASAAIITIDEVNGRAYVNQPISDIDITIYAYIIYGVAPNIVHMYRVMDILSRGDTAELTLIDASGYTYTDEEVRTLIPDSILLQKLYQQFSTSKNCIDIRVLLADQHHGALDLNGLSIKKLDGIELFSDIITELNISNIFINDFSPIAELTGLTSLIATAGNLDTSVLVDLDNLSYLYVYGCDFYDYSTNQKMDEYEALKYLYIVYKNNVQNLIRIFQDSTNAWNPYIVPTMDALTSLQSIYSVDYNETIMIPTMININMYGYEFIPVSTGASSIVGDYAFQYVLTSNRSSLSNYSFFTFNTTTGALTINKMPPEDTYSTITATLSIVNNESQVLEMTFKRNIMILQSMVKELHVEVPDGMGGFKYIPFEGAFGDLSLARTVSGLYDGTSTVNIAGVDYPYIRHSQLMGITTITFAGTNGGSIKGLEYLIGSTSLTTINFSYFRGPGYAGDSRVDLSIINSANFPNLRIMSFANSYVYMPDLYGLSALESLLISDSVRIDFGTEPATMASFTSLKTLAMYNSNIKSFEFIATLPQVENLSIYGNPASTKTITNSYVRGAYDNLVANTPGGNPSYKYYIVSSTLLWSPVDVSKITDFGVTAINGSGASVDVESPGYAGIYTVLDVVETITELNNNSKVYLPMNVEWTSTSPYIMNIDLDNNDGSNYIVTVRSLSVKTYVRLIGKLSNKILIYAFIIDSNGAAKVTTGAPAEGFIRFTAPTGSDVPAQMTSLNNKYVIDLDVFYNSNGSIDDTSFVNFALGSTNGFILSRDIQKYALTGAYTVEDNVSGVFEDSTLANLYTTYSSTVDGVTVLTRRLYAYFSGNTAATSVNREFRFDSIKGYRVFYRLNRFLIQNQEVDNIDELRYIKNVSYIQIDYTRIKSLWYLPNGVTDINQSRSVFENLTNLTYFSAVNIPIENDDFLPLVYKKYNLDSSEKTTSGVKNITTFQIARTLVNTSGTYHNYLFSDVRPLHLLFNEFAQSNSVTALKLSYQTFSATDLGGAANMSVLLADIAAFMNTSSSISGTFAVGDTLPVISVGSSQIYWTVDTGSFITINDAGTITADNNRVNGPIYIRGSIVRTRSGSGVSPVISRSFTINLGAGSGVRNDIANAKVELTAAEVTAFTTTIIDGVPYYSNSSISDNGLAGANKKYYVTASEAFPDISLRMSMFNYFDGLLSNFTYGSSDGIIDLIERDLIPYAQSVNSNNAVPHSNGGQNLDLARRNISNIKGIELFKNIEGFYLAGNPIASIPKLMLPTANKMQRMFFYGASNVVGGKDYAAYAHSLLVDISNLVFDADGNNANYRTISSSLRILDLRTNNMLTGEQYKYLTNIDLNPHSSGYLKDWKNNYPSLITLNVPSTITDYRYVPYLPHTVTTQSGLRPIGNTFLGDGSYSLKNSLEYYDMFCLDSVYSSAKTLTGTTLQDEISFLDSYDAGATTILPKTATIFGKVYRLGYLEGNFGTHTITRAIINDGGSYTHEEYSITIASDAPTEIQITAFTRFLSPHLDPNNPAHTGLNANWQKSTQEVVTLSVNSDIEVEDSVVIECEGTIQMTQGGPYEDLRLYVKDPVLRYWIMSYLDWGGSSTLATAIRDGKISYDEIYNAPAAHARATFTINASGGMRGVSDLTGIEILKDFGIETIAIRYGLTSDYSRLGVFKSVINLELRDNQVPVYDLSFINEMINLKALTLSNTFYTNMNFLRTNKTIEQLINLNGTTTGAIYGSEAVDAQFVRTEWAYARSNGKLSELESYMLTSGGTDPSFVSDAQIKLAAEILNTLSFEFDTELPESVTYNGRIYGDVPGAIDNTSLRFVSVCAGIDIDPVTRVATNNQTRETGLVLAILEYQGAFYERLFIVDLT